MGHKRFVTSDISIDGKVSEVAEVNPVAGLMWPWFLTALDDWARMTGNTREIKNSVFQSFKFTFDEIQAALDLYEDKQLMHLYEVNGKPYLQANPKAFYELNSYIQKSRQEHDASKIPPPTDHPWGRYWRTSVWNGDSQQKAAKCADELQEAATNAEGPQ